MPHRTLLAALLAGGTLAMSPSAFAEGERVAVVTPYLSAIATAEMVESFQERAAEYDWAVEVFDTSGDIGAMASRIEDVTTSSVDAIVIVSIDPAQLQDQVDRAAGAGIPIIAIDGSRNEALALNVTSDNYVLGQTMTEYLFDQLGGEGAIVRLFHSAHPGVRQREIALDDALEANPGISEIAQHYVQVPGQIDDSRSAMDSILLANQQEGAIDAVWAAWDEPGIGAQLALEAAGRDGIMIAGIDGNPQAIDLIESCTAYVATVRQGFSEMAEIAAEQLQQIFDGSELDEPERYAPVELITRDSLGVSCD